MRTESGDLAAGQRNGGREGWRRRECDTTHTEHAAVMGPGGLRIERQRWKGKGNGREGFG
eukprot:1753113-Pleurochrysis_carterae.AAC.2